MPASRSDHSALLAALRSGDARRSQHLWPGGGGLAPGQSALVSELKSTLSPTADNLEAVVAIRELLITELRAALASSDAVFTLSYFCNSAFWGSGPVDWYERYGLEALAQYGIGVALANERGTGTPDPATVQRCFDLVFEIFAIEDALAACATKATAGGPLELAIQHLVHENLFDRWQGYRPHLARITEAVFLPIAAPAEAELGWSPHHLPDLLAGIRDTANAKYSLKTDPLRRNIKERYVKGPSDSSEVTAAAVSIWESVLPDVLILNVQDIAEVWKLPGSRARTILDDLSVEFGCQPQFRRPTDENRARRFPLIRLGEGEYLVTNVVVALHEIHSWFPDLLEGKGLTDLLNHYRLSRDRATEELTATAFAEVFGEKAVHRGLTYEAPGHPDVDIFVEVPGDGLTIECKAHTLSAAGRRGAPRRIEAKLKELVDKPSFQSSRFVDHIKNGGAVRHNDGSSATLELDVSARLPRLAVSFERIDALALSAPEATTQSDVWVAALADVLLITEILDDPASLWRYALFRNEISQEHRVRPVSEVDLLSLFLEDGGAAIRDALQSQPKPVGIGPSSHAMNDYFGSERHRSRSRKPQVAVPIALREALRKGLLRGDEAWPLAVERVFNQPHTEWSRVHNFLRKCQRRTRGGVFSSECPAMNIIVEADTRGSISILIEVPPEPGPPPTQGPTKAH